MKYPAGVLTFFLLASNVSAEGDAGLDLAGLRVGLNGSVVAITTEREDGRPQGRLLATIDVNDYAGLKWARAAVRRRLDGIDRGCGRRVDPAADRTAPRSSDPDADCRSCRLAGDDVLALTGQFGMPSAWQNQALAPPAPDGVSRLWRHSVGQTTPPSGAVKVSDEDEALIRTAPAPAVPVDQ